MKKNIYKCFIIIFMLLISCNIIKNKNHNTQSSEIGLVLKNKICEIYDSISKKNNFIDEIFGVYILKIDGEKEKFIFSMSYVITTKPIGYLVINPSHKINYAKDIILIRYQNKKDSNIINRCFEKITNEDFNKLKKKLYKEGPGVSYDPITVICKYNKGKVSYEWINFSNELKYKYKITDYNYWKKNYDSLTKLE